MLKQLRDWWPALRKRRPIVTRQRQGFRPRLEALEPRWLMDANYWIAPAGSMSWDLDTNWSLGTHPNTGQSIFFDNAHSATPCSIPSGDVLPTLNSLTFGDWSGALYDPVNLTAATVEFDARTTPKTMDVYIASGATLNATTALNLYGGDIEGGGVLQAEGTITVNGSSATDKPTLKTLLKVGDGTAATTMTFQANSQPLVVSGGGTITVNAHGKIVFANTPAMGQNTVTAISNGDTRAHSIILQIGSELDRADNGECYVGMGVQMNGGTFNVNPDNIQGIPDGPLHLTGWNSDGFGLDVSGGTVTLNDSLSVDLNASISGGAVSIADGPTFTLGLTAASGPSRMSGGTMTLQGNLVAHGGLVIFAGGVLGTGGSLDSAITVDAGAFLTLEGGEIDVTDTANNIALGVLTVHGNFDGSGGGTIVDNVYSSASTRTYGKFKVLGNVSLSNSTTFTSKDVSPNPLSPQSFTYSLFSWTGSLSGECSVSLPTGWTYDWIAGSWLGVTENE